MTKVRTSTNGSDDEQSRVVERSNGFYWKDEFQNKFYGPFPNRLEALLSMQDQTDSDTDIGEGESLEDAEAGIGIANWIDPDTGEPAQDSSIHFSDE